MSKMNWKTVFVLTKKLSKNRDDDLVAKEISIGLIFTLMDGIAYLKEHQAIL